MNNERVWLGSRGCPQLLLESTYSFVSGGAPSRSAELITFCVEPGFLRECLSKAPNISVCRAEGRSLEFSIVVLDYSRLQYDLPYTLSIGTASVSAVAGPDVMPEIS